MALDKHAQAVAQGRLAENVRESTVYFASAAVTSITKPAEMKMSFACAGATRSRKVPLALCVRPEMTTKATVRTPRMPIGTEKPKMNALATPGATRFAPPRGVCKTAPILVNMPRGATVVGAKISRRLHASLSR